MAFSAGRGVVSGVVTRTRYTWRLLDRGRTTAIVHQPYTYQETGLADARYAPASGSDIRYPDLSGPYLVAAGHVFTPAGREIYARPGAAEGKKVPSSGTDDLFGPRLVFARSVHGSDIWLRDLDRPESPSNPVKIAHTNRSEAAVTIWGNTVAWQSGARQISLRTLNSKKIRRIPTSAALYELTLGEVTLAWTSRQRTYLLNTRSADSGPVALAGTGNTIRLDDHYLARRVNAGNVVAYRNPFTDAYRPRLIGTFAAKSFIAPGSWKPEFDLTKPVKDVRLVIRSTKTGSTLRTLAGTGPDGSIRDLAFDGRNAKGKVLADGTYHWQLLASAKDGDGTLIGIRGEKQVTGTVTIERGIVKR